MFIRFYILVKAKFKAVTFLTPFCTSFINPFFEGNVISSLTDICQTRFKNQKEFFIWN